MSTDTQALARGTRVEITDTQHQCYRSECVITDGPDGIGAYWVTVFPRYVDELTPDQFRVIEQPEPTVGQLVDAMHQEIERYCKAKKNYVQLTSTEYRPVDREFSISIGFSDGEVIKIGRPAMHAALRAMIERLKAL